jgi:hypothetical protein
MSYGQILFLSFQLSALSFPAGLPALKADSCRLKAAF